MMYQVSLKVIHWNSEDRVHDALQILLFFARGQGDVVRGESRRLETF